MDRDRLRRRRGVRARVFLAGHSLAAWALAGAMLGACSVFRVGPDYVEPEAATAKEWLDYRDPRIGSEEVDLSRWWSVFQDPALDELVEGAMKQNLSLLAAGERIRAARARARFAFGNLFPQQQEAFGSVTESRASQEAADSVPGADVTVSDWQLGFAAAWELDFWGAFRRAIESADAELEASVAEYDDALVLMLAEVARSFVLYRVFQERLVHVRENLDIQQRSYELTRERFDAGAVTERDVQQAKQVLEQTRSRIPPLDAGVRQAGNALCVLIGSPPVELSEILGASEGIPGVPTSVALGIPADLLRRRPDVRRAERLAAAQSARIGIAKAEYYPRFSILGTIGVRAEEASDLFDGSSSRVGSIGGAFRWNILHYGRIAALVEGEEAEFQARVAEFQEAVLRAGQEADDAAALFLAAQDEASALAESVAASRRTVEITLDQYSAGAIDFTPVFLFQATLTEQEDALAVARGQIALNLIDLYRALGGGWGVAPHEGS